MEITNLERDNKINIENNLINEKTQKDFLETTLGKTINTAVDIGIRAIFPEFLEEQIINIKDNLLNYGLKEGINKTIDDAIDLGKSAIGIVTGNFENISQMKKAVKSGGLIDGISSVLDKVVDEAKKAGILKTKLANTIKQGKNIILNNVERNIEKNFNEQYETIEKVNKYVANWRNSFNNQDFEGMKKEYKKIEKQFKYLAPIQKTIDNIKTIDILHNLIKNNGQNFNLTEQQIELAEKLK